MSWEETLQTDDEINKGEPDTPISRYPSDSLTNYTGGSNPELEAAMTIIGLLGLSAMEYQYHKDSEMTAKEYYKNLYNKMKNKIKEIKMQRFKDKPPF
mgnify:CR=1 FL=1